MTPAPLTSRLFVERLHNRYLAAGEQGAAEILRDRLESSILTDLPSALARILEPTLNPEDQSIWFVRQLALDFPLNAEIHQGSVARIWAEQIAGGLIDAMREGDDAIRFADRTLYLAQFLLDIVDGIAWDNWYYESFAGLRALSVTAAVRTAILDDPEIGLRALENLAEKAFGVARALCPADAARVLSGLAGPSTGKCAECVSTVATAAARTLHVSAGDEQRHALVLFLASHKNEPALDRGMLAEASRAIARLLRCVAEGALALSQLRAGTDLAAIYRALGPDYAPLLAPLITAGSTALNALLLPGVESPATAFTHFGGMFLLLPLIDELPIIDGSNGWPNAGESNGETSAASLIRFLILVKCLGGQQAFGCSSDPLVRDSMGVPPDLDWQSIARWSTRVQPEHLDQLLDALLAWRLETAAAIGPPFEFVRARRPGAREFFEVDPGRGIWIRRAIPPNRAEVLRDATQDLEYLSFPRALGVRRRVDIALSIAAQGVLRSFAWKLPGFSQSSLPYLATNFLSCTAAVEQQIERTVVRIGRTPLNPILGMTGLNRCAYSVSWTPLPYALFPEG